MHECSDVFFLARKEREKERKTEREREREGVRFLQCIVLALLSTIFNPPPQAKQGNTKKGMRYDRCDTKFPGAQRRKYGKDF